MVNECESEAEYWIDTTEGFLENLMTEKGPETFYLCLDHMNEIESNGDQEGYYTHLRIDTGEIEHYEIGKYCCSEDCEECMR
jgi:hypothetical protein